MCIDLKVIFAIIALILLVVGYYPYFRDMFHGKTKPHTFTWLVWGITQGTATAGLWYGGGKFSTLSAACGTLLVAIIFFLSFKYGTRNITKSDTGVLASALSAIVVW